MTMAENDLRLGILNTLLTTPHRALATIRPVHAEMVAQDPRFYVRLAAWYADHGDVRDHKEMFVVTLCLSDFDGHRDVGLALLRDLPPYQVGRVVDFIHGRKKTVFLKDDSKAQKDVRRSKWRKVFGAAKDAAKPENGVATAEPAKVEFVPVLEEFGLFRNVPRSVRTEVERYLRERETDADWFDSSVLTARKAFKRLYAILHVKPSGRAQQILFDREPPADSRLFQLRQLAKAATPAEQARAIVENRIPYRVASTVIKQMTPTVLVALIDSMSPQELINSVGSLKKRGAFDNPELKALIEEKLGQAKTATRVSAFKAEKALEAADFSEDVKAKLEAVADTQIKAKGRITRPTALLVDKSASMTEAIELGKRLGSMISAVCEEKLYAYAFDTLAYEIEAKGKALSDWEKAFRGITAGGSTSVGVPLSTMVRKNQYVEQIIVVTDEGENTPPLFVQALEQYREQMKADPHVVLVRTPGGANHLESQLRTKQAPVDVFHFTGDYYSLPNLVPMLARPSKLELLMEILDYPLPKRRAG